MVEARPSVQVSIFVDEEWSELFRLEPDTIMTTTDSYFRNIFYPDTTTTSQL
jgi:hypothetical protein